MKKANFYRVSSLTLRKFCLLTQPTHQTIPSVLQNPAEHTSLAKLIIQPAVAT